MPKFRFQLCLFVVAFCALTVGLSGQDNIEALEEDAVRTAVGRVANSVIRFETIGGTNRVDGVVVSSGPATGVVVSEDGYVVSASFHFAHQPASIFARLPDGQRATAEIIGRDESRKIVLLKIQTDFEFEVPKWVEPEKVPVGATVVAVGRVLDAENPSVSTGIVSARDRVWDRAIQTDAKISPANFGGPLLDLRGDVIGILVPLSPDDDAEMAGTDWYDSGIGFAVSFANILDQLESLKAGKTLRAGVAGISLKGSDAYVDPAVIAFCRGSSPAGKAGMKQGDRIVEINGRRISRQSDMKHALGPLYEGETADFVVLRGKERLKFGVELVGEIQPFVPPGIGLVASQELIIEFVFADGGARSAGLAPGDRIVTLNRNVVEDRDQLRLALAAAEIGSEVMLEIERAGELKTLDVSVGAQTATPPVFEATESPDLGEPSTIIIDIPDFANQCFAFVPKQLEGASEPGLLVWISAPGKLKQEMVEQVWLQHAQANNVIVLVLESADEKRWRPGEIDFIVRAVETLGKRTAFDRTRVVAGGRKTGGAMASLLVFSHRDLFQGLVLIDSAVSQRVGSFATSPVQPLMVLMGNAIVLDDPQKASHERLETAHFPVHVQFNGSEKITDWSNVILNWVNGVNRF